MYFILNMMDANHIIKMINNISAQSAIIGAQSAIIGTLSFYFHFQIIFHSAVNKTKNIAPCFTKKYNFSLSS